MSGEGAVSPSLSEAEVVESGIDVVSPNVARIYNAYSHGALNFATDRDFARAAATVFPAIFDGVLDNRSFLRRAVATMAASGLRQFLDLGAGISMSGNVHETARRYRPEARIISVDNEPVAVASNRGKFVGDSNALAIFDDLREPELIFRRSDVRGLFDLDEPIGIILGAVLHFIPSTDDATDIMARYVREIPAGSWIAISHGSMDAAPPEQQDQMTQFVDKYRNSTMPLYLRDHVDVVRFFTGLIMVSPVRGADGLLPGRPCDQACIASDVQSTGADGVVHLPDWRPDESMDGEQKASEAHHCAWCGVGRKPPP